MDSPSYFHNKAQGETPPNKPQLATDLNTSKYRKPTRQINKDITGIWTKVFNSVVAEHSCEIAVKKADFAVKMFTERFVENEKS